MSGVTRLKSEWVMTDVSMMMLDVSMEWFVSIHQTRQTMHYDESEIFEANTIRIKRRYVPVILTLPTSMIVS